MHKIDLFKVKNMEFWAAMVKDKNYSCFALIITTE
jgi:hypothetical protein